MVRTLPVRVRSAREVAAGAEAHDDLALLVHELVLADDRAAAGAVLRRPRLDDPAAPGEDVAGPHRNEPAELLDAGRPEARAVEQDVAHEEAHVDRGAVPAARDQPAERPFRSRLRIDVERLRVVPPRELDDLLGGHLVRAVRRLVARLEVLPVLHGSGREWTTTSVFVGRVSATYSSRNPCSPPSSAMSAGSTTTTWSNSRPFACRGVRIGTDTSSKTSPTGAASERGAMIASNPSNAPASLNAMRISSSSSTCTSFGGSPPCRYAIGGSTSGAMRSSSGSARSMISAGTR